MFFFKKITPQPTRQVSSVGLGSVSFRRILNSSSQERMASLVRCPRKVSQRSGEMGKEAESQETKVLVVFVKKPLVI